MQHAFIAYSFSTLYRPSPLPWAHLWYRTPSPKTPPSLRPYHELSWCTRQAGSIAAETRCQFPQAALSDRSRFLRRRQMQQRRTSPQISDNVRSGCDLCTCWPGSGCTSPDDGTETGEGSRSYRMTTDLCTPCWTRTAGRSSQVCD